MVSILRGPIEAIIGTTYGVLLGVLLWFIPERCGKQQKNKQKCDSKMKQLDTHRFVLLLLSALFALFGSVKLGLGGAGPLAILVISFVASLRWRPCGFDAYNER